MISETAILSDTYLDEVDALVKDYLTDFPDDEARLKLLLGQLRERDNQLVNRKNMAGHLTASALLVNQSGDAVFLIYHNFLRLWLQPGGHIDFEEAPLDAAFREFIEETGIKDVRLHEWHASHAIPFDMDTHAIPANHKKDEGKHFHHDFQYLLRLSADSPDTIAIAQEEVSQYRWVPFKELIECEHDSRLKRVAGKIKQLL